MTRLSKEELEEIERHTLVCGQGLLHEYVAKLLAHIKSVGGEVTQIEPDFVEQLLDRFAGKTMDSYLAHSISDMFDEIIVKDRVSVAQGCRAPGDVQRQEVEGSTPSGDAIVGGEGRNELAEKIEHWVREATPGSAGHLLYQASDEIVKALKSIPREGESGPGFSSGAASVEEHIIVSMCAAFVDVLDRHQFPILRHVPESIGIKAMRAALQAYTEKPKDQTSPSPSPDRAGERNAMIEGAARWVKTGLGNWIYNLEQTQRSSRDADTLRILKALHEPLVDALKSPTPPLEESK